MTGNSELPDGWTGGAGEASRPLHEGGYYLHTYSRVLDGSNQHQKKIHELRVDTVGMPPRKHVLKLSKRLLKDGDSRDLGTLKTETVTVDDPEDAEAQADAEEEIHDLAHAVMANY